jgi:methyl-accepting chemotaxis protein
MLAQVELLHLNETNLGLRREFAGLTDERIQLLAELAPWAREVAPRLSTEFYDDQFGFTPTRDFFREFAAAHGISLEQLREFLERAQAGYFVEIFEEAEQGGGFGPEYFEKRLHVGHTHSVIQLPFKWYLGSYTIYVRLVIAHVQATWPDQPQRCVQILDALLPVFVLDMEAIVEAFYFDTLKAMGVRLELLAPSAETKDLSDQLGELKALVSGPLQGIARTLTDMHGAASQLHLSAGEVTEAVAAVAGGITEIATDAQKQVGLIDQEHTAVAEAATLAGESLGDTRSGIEAMGGVTEAMDGVLAGAKTAGDAMARLAERAAKIGGIVKTINDIAGQTNLLALNAAIEAARAGEHGRGFAVVADEVRRLADSSRQSSLEIQGLIKEMDGEVKAAVSAVESGLQNASSAHVAVDQAQQSFSGIMDRVETIDSHLAEIVTSTSEVAGVAQRFSDTAEQIAAAAQQTAASMDEVTSTAHDLEDSEHKLEEIVANFDVRDGQEGREQAVAGARMPAAA